MARLNQHGTKHVVCGEVSGLQRGKHHNMIKLTSDRRAGTERPTKLEDVYHLGGILASVRPRIRHLCSMLEMFRKYKFPHTHKHTEPFALVTLFSDQERAIVIEAYIVVVEHWWRKCRTLP